MCEITNELLTTIEKLASLKYVGENSTNCRLAYEAGLLRELVKELADCDDLGKNVILRRMLNCYKNQITVMEQL